MADAPTSQRTTQNEGFFEHSRGLLAALSGYLHARLKLAGIETKEAFVHYGIIIGLAIGALAVVLFGYLFLLIGLMFVLAELLNISKGWTLLILALAHFGVAVLCLLIARTRLTVPMFTATIAEFKKDQQWLSSTNTTTTPKQS
jgi:uncharacterized membrane protein YqjE